tara:strand:+ start:3987 stop:4181 length:195 start_codon:yes stop_codon:yes gene_type:complete
MKDERMKKLRAAAIFAVFLDETRLVSLTTSAFRGKGRAWAHDHRRVTVGKRSLMISNSERSNIR